MMSVRGEKINVLIPEVSTIKDSARIFYLIYSFELVYKGMLENFFLLMLITPLFKLFLKIA